MKKNNNCKNKFQRKIKKKNAKRKTRQSKQRPNIRVLVVHQPRLENGRIIPHSPEFEVRTIRETLNSYYEIIRCDTIDMEYRSINGKTYNIVLDDDGRSRDDNFITFKHGKNESEDIYGTIVIAGNTDENGLLTSLTTEDIKNIEKAVYTANFTRYDGSEAGSYHMLYTEEEIVNSPYLDAIFGDMDYTYVCM